MGEKPLVKAFSETSRERESGYFYSLFCKYPLSYKGKGENIQMINISKENTMAHFYEYLEFNSDEDRENQLEVYVDIKLQSETEEKLKSLAVQGDWLIVAEPYCPDCVEIVAYFQRMAKLNPNIRVNYLSRKDSKERKFFDTDEQQQAVISAQKIPTIVNVQGGKAELALVEFPAFLKAKMAATPEQFDELKADFRMGKFGKEVEAELLAILTRVM